MNHTNEPELHIHGSVESSMECEYDSDQVFLESLCKQYRKLMCSVAMKVTGSAADLEDIVQDTITELIPRVSLLRSLSIASRACYVAMAVKGNAIGHIRKKCVLRKWFFNLSNFSELEVADQETPEIIYVRQEEIEQLGQAISQLPEPDQELLYMKYILDYDYKRLCLVFNVKPAALRKRQERVLRKVRELMGGDNR